MWSHPFLLSYRWCSEEPLNLNIQAFFNLSSPIISHYSSFYQSIICINTLLYTMTGGGSLQGTITVLRLWCIEQTVWENIADVIGKQMLTGRKVNWDWLFILFNSSTVREPYVTEISISSSSETLCYVHNNAEWSAWYRRNYVHIGRFGSSRFASNSNIQCQCRK